MKPPRSTCLLLVGIVMTSAPGAARAVELPGHYFQLLHAELARLDKARF